jgi:molybdopterin-binding protein
MKLSARNVFKGKVVDIDKGQVTAIVRVDIGGGNVVTRWSPPKSSPSRKDPMSTSSSKPAR